MVVIDNYPQADGMISQNGIGSFKPGAAITKGMTVYLSAADTVLMMATGHEAAFAGVALEDASAANTPAYISVALPGSGIVVKCFGNGTVGLGATCIAADGGKVGDWPGSPAIGDVPKIVGKVLDAGITDLDRIRVVL